MYKNRRPRMKKALGPIEEPDDLPPPVESRNTRSTPKKSALRFDEDETETTHKRRSLSKKETDELHTHSTRAKALKPANGQARRDPQSQSPERAVELNRSKLKRSELGLGLSPNRSASKRTRRTSESPLGPMLETAKASKAKPRMNVTSSDSEDEIGPSQNSTLKPLANSTQLSLGAKQQNKISRAIVKPYFEEVLLMSGFRFGKGQNCNILDRDQPAFLLKFKAEIEKNGRGQKNLEEFIKGFESYISEPHNFFKALDTTDTEDDSSATRKSQPCLVRLLLMVNSIQPKLMTILFDKLIGIVCAGNRQDEEAFELVQKILRTMRYLDHLVDGSAVCEQLLNLVELAEAVDVKREVISFIPDIISDAEHEKVASDLSEMLSANPPLIPAILCSLENLIMAPDTRDIVITKVLDILDRAPLNQQHTIMQFLTTVGTEMGLIVREIRKYINLDPSAAGNDGSEVAIFAENLKETVLNSKSLLDTWLDVLTNTEKKTFLPVDIVALLVFYQNSLDRKKSEVISAIKQHAHLGLDADKAISQAVPVIICVIEKYLDATLTIASTLLECRDSSVSRHGAIWFSLLVEHLQGTPSQQVINHLLGHVGSKAADQVSLALDILFDSGKKKIQSIAPYAHQLYGLLDKMEEWELTQVRQVLRLLCMLAYSCNEAMFLQDDIIMLVRKQLASSNPMWRTRGIIGAISAIQHMNALDGLDLLKHGFSIFSDASIDGCGLFYDELATLMDVSNQATDKGDLPDPKLDWLYDQITDRFSETVALDYTQCKDLGKFSYDLNGAPETSISISFVMNRQNKLLLPVLCPLVRLLTSVVYKKTGSLSDVDAVLGAPVILPDVDYSNFDLLSEEEQKDTLDSLFYCINYFRELANGFTVGPGDITLLLARMENIVQLEQEIAKYLSMVGDYTPPQCQFYYNAKVPHINKPKPKGKGKAGKKTIKKGSKKNVDENDSSSNSPSKTGTTVDRTNSTLTTKQPTDLSLYEQFLRGFELRIFILSSQPLKIGPPSEHVESSISLKLMQFLLMDNLKKLNYFLVTKTNTFGREPTIPKYNTMVPKSASEIALVSTRMLPYLRAQLDITGDYLRNLIRENDDVLDSLGMFVPEATDIKRCHTLILQNVLAIVSWPGFHNLRNKDLLTKMVRNLNSTVGQASGSTQSEPITYFRKQKDVILHITAADTLVKLIRTLLSYLPEASSRKTKYVHELCNEFLARRWTDFKGMPENGAVYNRQIESILSVYMDTFPSNEKLERITQLIKEIERQALAMEKKDDLLESFPAITKSNFDIVYKTLFSTLVEVAKLGTTLEEWKKLIDAYESLTDILRKQQFQLRSFKLTFAKYTSQYVKIFLMNGFPIVEKELRYHSSEVNYLLKTLQGCTRFAQNLIYDGKQLKDSSLVNHAPIMRLMFEKLIMRVKSALTGENCGKAFYCGTLKNKNLSGETIDSQMSNDDTQVDSAKESDNEEDDDDDEITRVDSDSDEDKVSSQSVIF